MREKILDLGRNFGRTFWQYANSNAGSALTGAIGAYLLTKGSREDELISVKNQLSSAMDDNQTFKSDNQSLKENLLKRDQQITALLHSSQNNQGAHNDTREKLLRCENQQQVLEYAYVNTRWCLFKPDFQIKGKPSQPESVNNKNYSELNREGNKP